MKLQLESTYFWHRSSELQVLGCWRRSIRTSVFRVLGTWSSDQQVFNNDDTHQSFQSSRSLELDQIQSTFWLSSSEFKSFETEDVQQNFWSSGFFGTWFFRIDVLSSRLLSCRDLQNFRPLETGDVHSELLVFSLLWRLVLQSL